MGMDTTTVNGILKPIFGEGDIIDLINVKTPTLDKIGKSSRAPSGEGYQFPALVERNMRGIGAIKEKGALRQSATNVAKKYKVSPKVQTARCDFTGLSMAIATGNVDAFADATTFEMNTTQKDFKKDIGQQLHRDSTGKLAQVNGAVSGGTTITFDNGVPSHLREGMYIEIYNGSTLQTPAPVKITDVSSAFSSNQITVGTAVTVSDDAYIYREDTYQSTFADNIELSGLPLWTDDGTITTTYENISRSTYPIWKGLSINQSSASLSDDMLQQARSRLEHEGGVDPNTIISNTSQVRKYILTTLPQIQYEPGKARDSGHPKNPTWNGLEWIVDPDCPFDTIYMCDLNELEKYDVRGMQWDTSNGGIIKHNPNTDSFYAYCKYYGDFGTGNPKGAIKIYGLATPTY